MNMHLDLYALKFINGPKDQNCNSIDALVVRPDSHTRIPGNYLKLLLAYIGGLSLKKKRHSPEVMINSKHMIPYDKTAVKLNIKGMHLSTLHQTPSIHPSLA